MTDVVQATMVARQSDAWSAAMRVALIFAYDDVRGSPVQNAVHSGYQRISAGESEPGLITPGQRMIIGTSVPES